MDREIMMVIDQKNRELIESAKKFLKENPPPPKMTKNGMRNLLDAATTAVCIEEISSFIEYQIGKDFKTWNDNGFGVALLSTLDKGELRDQISKIREKLSSVDSDAIGVLVAGRWFGYLYRRFRFLEVEKRHDSSTSDKEKN